MKIILGLEDIDFSCMFNLKCRTNLINLVFLVNKRVIDI